MNFILYYAALSADAIFEALLVAEYGKNACNMRYDIFAKYPEPINVALRQKIAADDAWINYQRTVSGRNCGTL